MPFYFYAPKVHGKESRPCYRVEVIGFKRVKRLTDLLIHFPSGKLERLQLVRDFCLYKLSVPFGEKNSEATYKEIQRYKNLLKAKNFEHRGAITSETTRSTSLEEEDIVRTHAKS